MSLCLDIQIFQGKLVEQGWKGNADRTISVGQTTTHVTMFCKPVKGDECIARHSMAIEEVTGRISMQRNEGDTNFLPYVDLEILVLC